MISRKSGYLNLESASPIFQSTYPHKQDLPQFYTENAKGTALSEVYPENVKAIIEIVQKMLIGNNKCRDFPSIDFGDPPLKK